MFDSEIPGRKRENINTFILCFLQYVFVHSCRSTWSYISGDIVTQGLIDGFTTKFLGYINFTFMLSLGGSLILFGQIGDKMNLKVFMLFGMFSSAILFIFMAILLQYTSINKYLFLLMMAIIGAVSSPTWPGLLAIINNWFPQKNKVLLMGFFAASMNVGNIVGFVYSGLTIEEMGLPYLTPVYLSAGSLLLMSFINLYFLKVKPDGPIETPKVEDVEKPAKEDQAKLKTLSWFKAWTLPGVAIYAFSLGCIKTVFLVLGFWLPAYLDSLQVQHVAFINIMIDLGAITGGIGICYIGFNYHKRATIIVPSLWVGTIFMIAINFLKSYDNPVGGYMILVFFTGVFIGGCYNNIMAAITIELSSNQHLLEYKNATSTVASIMLGYSTTFLALNQIVIPYVKHDLFLYCGFQSMIGGLMLFPIVFHEWKPQQSDKVEDVQPTVKELELME